MIFNLTTFTILHVFEGALAPTQSEPPFLVTQLFALALFVVLTIVAAIKFRFDPVGARVRTA